MMHSSGLDQIRRSLQHDADSLDKALGGLDSRLDKQRFFEYNNAAFMIPKKFEYNPVRRDESETLVQKSIMDELESRKTKLKERLATLKVDSEEIWKSMESAEKTLSDMVAATDYDTTRFFVEEDRNAIREPEAIVQKQKADRQEIEEFYTSLSFLADDTIFLTGSPSLLGSFCNDIQKLKRNRFIYCFFNERNTG